MSTSPPLSAMPQQQHHHHHSRRLEEQQEQQNRHFQRLEQYRQHPVLPSQSHTYGYHPHPYHPYHSHHNVHSSQHQQQLYSSSLLPPLPIDHQTSPVDLPSSSQQDSTFFSPTLSWQQQQLSSSPISSNLQQLLFDENSVPFEGFSVPSEYAWGPLVDSGSNLLAASAGPDLFPAGLDTSGYFFSTPDLSATQHDNAAAAVAVAGSANQPTTLSSRRTVSGPQRQRSLKLRVDRRIDMYTGPERQNVGQPNNNKLQTIMPLHPNELCGSSSSPAPPLSPLGKVDTNGSQSSLVQSLANLTTSSPNLACLSPPAFSSTFGQNPFNFPDSQRSIEISSDHLSGLYTQSDEGINNNSNSDQDTNDNNSKAAAEAEDDESDRRFQCPVCPKRFLRQYNLNAHLKTHSQVRAHACTLCNKSFLRPYDLARHQRIHSNSKPYTCNICQLIFIRNDAIWRHYRRAHLGHPDVPPARRQRKPQRISISPSTTTTNTIIITNITGDSNNNNNNLSSLYSSVASPTYSTSVKSTASPTFSPHDIISHDPSSLDTSSAYLPPSASVTFTSMELPSLE